MIQRVKFIDKFGHPYDMVLDVIRKDSRYLRTLNPQDGKPYDIPRNAVESISEPEKIKTNDKAA